MTTVVPPITACTLTSAAAGSDMRHTHRWDDEHSYARGAFRRLLQASAMRARSPQGFLPPARAYRARIVARVRNLRVRGGVSRPAARFSGGDGSGDAPHARKQTAFATKEAIWAHSGVRAGATACSPPNPLLAADGNGRRFGRGDNGFSCLSATRKRLAARKAFPLVLPPPKGRAGGLRERGGQG